MAVTKDSDGGSGDLGPRVAALERGFEKLDGKIDKLTELVGSFGLKTSERLGGIEARLAGIEAKLDAKAAKSDLAPIEVKLGTVDGRLSNLPTVWQTIAIIATLLFGVATLSFAVSRYWPDPAPTKSPATSTP